MKKIKNVVLILALFLCFNGCEKNPAEVATSSNNDELTVDQAKAFVETQRMNEFTLKSGKSEKKRINIRSDWNKSERSNNGDISVIETQIEAMGQFGFATPDCMEAWNTSKNDDYLYSMSRLVVIKHKKSGEMYSFIMSVVGDKHYLEGKNFKIWDNTYLKRDKELSGLVLFHDLSGAFVNGWIYCDGQITNSIIKPIDLDLTINLKSAMVLQAIYDWVKECSYWQYNYVASDGTATVVSKRCTEGFVVVGYYEIGGSGNGSSDGSYTPTIPPCNCLDRCPTCGKCIGSTLKSAIVPSGGTTTTTPTTDPCESCTCPPKIQPKTIDKIMGVNNLDPTQTELLEKALNDLIDEKCLTKTVYNSLVNQGFKINFQMKSDIPGLAAYEPTNKTLYFKDASQINSANLKEELFHAEQDANLGGTAQYKTTGRVNIEFEAKLYKDITTTNCCGAFQIGIAPLDLRKSYEDWVFKIQANPSNISDTEYQYWLNQFNNYTPAYSSPLNSNLSSPNTLKSMILNCF